MKTLKVRMPSLLLAVSLSSLMRSSTCFCFRVCGAGMYSPFEIICVGMGDSNARAS